MAKTRRPRVKEKQPVVESKKHFQVSTSRARELAEKFNVPFFRAYALAALEVAGEALNATVLVSNTDKQGELNVVLRVHTPMVRLPLELK